MKKNTKRPQILITNASRAFILKLSERSTTVLLDVEVISKKNKKGKLLLYYVV